MIITILCVVIFGILFLYWSCLKVGSDADDRIEQMFEGREK
jgi:hypothetical protein